MSRLAKVGGGVSMTPVGAGGTVGGGELPGGGCGVTVDRDCQIVCAWAELSHIDEAFAEDDGELCLRLDPFTRRPLPRLGRMIEHQI